MPRPGGTRTRPIRRGRSRPARLQFAAALAAAGEKDLNPSPALLEAAKLLIADQKAGRLVGAGRLRGPARRSRGAPPSPPGWHASRSSPPAGSPTTSRSRRPTASCAPWRSPTSRCGRGAAGSRRHLRCDGRQAAGRVPRNLRLRAAATAADGGPDADSPATVFDTALVMLALHQLESDPRLARSTYRVEELRGGARRRVAPISPAQQQPDGSWPETMRPAPSRTRLFGSRRPLGRWWRFWEARSR